VDEAEQDEAEQAYARAIGLSEGPAVREFLASRSESLSTD
jgi:predicted RNA polymerase sigma factor